MRLLPVIRLSVETDETTSPERQMERIALYARMGDHALIPIKPEDYDLDVSGAVSPFDRPGLGPWLRDDRLGMWDALCVAKLDRLTRSMLDFETLIRWLEKNGKTLVCLDPPLDLSTPAGKAFGQVIVAFAEFERATIGARVREAHQKLMQDGRYAGGRLQYGYRPVRMDDGRGWGIEPDPEDGPRVAEICDRYVRYESLGSICKWLNTDGVLAPLDAMRKRNGGKDLKGTPWTPATLRVVLTGPGIMGAAVKRNGEPIRDDDGVIVYRAAPLVSRDVWERVQARLAETRTTAKVNTSPLLRVVFCTCGAPMYSRTSRVKRGDRAYVYRHVVCARSGEYHHAERPCTARGIDADKLETAVYGALLGLVGSYELVERKMVAGRDYAEDIARMKDLLSHLAGEIEMGEALGDDVAELIVKRGRARAELRRLVALEPVTPRPEPVKTGKTFRQHWESLGTVQRNEFLRSAGVRAVASRNQLPPLDLESGPLTADDIPRSVILDEDGLKAVIDLGGLRDLLARTSAV